jgi:putative endonuclease
VYILHLIDGSLYVGYSSDLKQRIAYHQEKRVISTKHKQPQLLWYCAFHSKKKAISFEKYLKSSSGFAFRNKHFV